MSSNSLGSPPASESSFAPRPPPLRRGGGPPPPRPPAPPPPPPAASGGPSGPNAWSLGGPVSRLGGSESPSDLPGPGESIGPYVILRVLGVGGMGAVFLAERRDSGLVHALKVILGSVLENDAGEAIARFRREAEVLARVDAHPGVVNVHAYGVDGLLPWCAMDFVVGVSLQDRLRRDGPMRPEAAADLVAVVASAVDHLHGHGIVHRDLKPDNVLIDGDGRPKLLDFGLAHDDSAQNQLTQTGQLIGTPGYMAPEQVAPSTDDGPFVLGPATDVYGLGAVLYALLTGHAPFEGDDTQSILVDVFSVPPRRPTSLRPDIPVDLEAICLKALEKRPDDRYDSAGSMADDIERFRRGSAVDAIVPGILERARRRLLRSRLLTAAILLGAVVAVLGAVTLVLAARSRREQEEIDAIARARAWRDEVDAIEARVRASADAIPPSLTTRLRDIAAEPSVDPDLRERTELLVAIAGLVHPSTTGPARVELSGRIAAAVRPAGEVDVARLEVATDALLLARRLDALYRIRYVEKPTAPARGEAATALARHLAETPADVLPLPATDAGFQSLYGADDLDDATRGALLARRSEAAAADGNGVVAVAAAMTAFAEHGVVAPSARWTREMTAIGGRSFVDAFAAGDDRRADAILRHLVRVEGRTPELDVDEVVRFHVWLRSAQPSRSEGRGEAIPIDRVLLLGAFLEWTGDSPFRAEHIEDAWGGADLAKLAEVAEREADRPVDARNPALLMLAQRFVGVLDSERDADELRRAFGDEDPDDMMKRWVEAAEATDIDARWLHALLAFTYEWWLRDRERAWVHVQRAHELERELAPEERWPLVGERYLDLIIDRAERVQPPPLDAFVAAAAAALPVVEVQELLRDRLAEIEARGGDAPWVLSRADEVADELDDVGDAFVEAFGDACCETAIANDVPTPDVLFTRALALALSFGWNNSEVRKIPASDAAHHEHHDRDEEAYLAKLRQVALELDEAYARPSVDRERPLWKVENRASRYAFRFLREDAPRPDVSLLAATLATGIAQSQIAAQLDPDPARQLELARLRLQRRAALRGLGQLAEADHELAMVRTLVRSIRLSDDELDEVRRLLLEGKPDEALAKARVGSRARVDPSSPKAKVLIQRLTMRALVMAWLGRFQDGEALMSAGRRIRGF